MMMKFLCHVRLGPATLRDDTIVNIVNITFVVSVSPVSVYSLECTDCRVHHLNMITSYKLRLSQVRSGPVLAASVQITSKVIFNAGEAVM